MKKLLLLLSLAACASGPAPVPTPTPSAASTESPDFNLFVDDYFKAFFTFHPSAATQAGFHEYDSELEDFSRAHLEARIAELHAEETRLAPFLASKIFDEQIDARAIAGGIKGELVDLELIATWRSNPMFYTALSGRSLDGLVKRNFAPPAVRLKAVIARLKKVPAVYLAAKANLENPPKEFTDTAMRMARGSVAYFEHVLPGWAHQTAAGDAALLAEFDAADAQAAAAAKDYLAWLEQDLLPRSKGTFVLGPEKLAAKLAADEMITEPLDELRAKGERRLAEDWDAAVALAKQIDPSKTPAQVYATMAAQHFSEAGLIPEVAKTLESIRKFIVDHDIITIPSEVRPAVEETPGYSRMGGFAMMDTPGAYEDKATEAFYYVTPPEKDWDASHKEQHLGFYNPANVELISIHEVFPGHYVEFLYAPRFPTKTRKLIHASSNSEGWAHYAEQMMIEQGFGGDDPHLKLAQRAMALQRDCRYLSGVNLHTGKWTLDQATACFEEKAFLSHANAYEEAKRGTFNPTYLYYTWGKLEILRLRDDFLKQTGLTLKDFHNAFVAQGAIPLPLVREILLRRM